MADAFLALTKKDESSTIPQEKAAEAFNKLSPISIADLLGEWDGGSLNTGHPGHEQMKGMNWAGKTFKSEDDVDPIVVYGEDKKRVWLEAIGKARIREVKYRGVVSAAMVYDTQPIIDHFRVVNDDMVAGAMDTKLYGPDNVFYFYLTKTKA